MVSVLEELEGLFPSAASETVQEIALDRIAPDPGQPRKEFDPAELDDLALSIDAHGVLAPILLRPDPDRPGHYLIVTGERRYHASQRARRTTIPALLREVEPGLLLALQLVENVQRTDLRPLETAQALAGLLAATPGLTQARAAALVGKSPTWVSQHLALLDAEGSTQEALAEDLLQSPETARLFGQLPEAGQKELLEKARAVGEPITRTAVRSAQPVGSRLPPPVRKAGRPPKEKTVALPPLTAAQLAVLFTALDLGPVPRTQAEIWEALVSRLSS